MPVNSHLNFSRVLITGITPLTNRAFLLSFTREITFHAGQVMAVRLSPLEEARYYSIASGIRDPEIELLFDVKPGGSLTPRLARLKPGDTIEVSEPAGLFLGTEEPACWIATGTGIAPFRSMLRSGLAAGKTLLHGARTAEGLYFAGEITAALGPDYIRCLSGETAPGCYPGRVTGYLTEAAGLPADKLYYLCGKAEMVVDSREILLERGIPFAQIIAEVYF